MWAYSNIFYETLIINNLLTAAFPTKKSCKSVTYSFSLRKDRDSNPGYP